MKTPSLVAIEPPFLTFDEKANVTCEQGLEQLNIATSIVRPTKFASGRTMVSDKELRRSSSKIFDLTFTFNQRFEQRVRLVPIATVSSGREAVEWAVALREKLRIFVSR